VPHSLELQIAGESLFNDGIGVVAFIVMQKIAVSGQHASAARIDLNNLFHTSCCSVAGGTDLAANSPRFLKDLRHSAKYARSRFSASRPCFDPPAAITKSTTILARIPDRVICSQNASRSNASFSPSLNMKQTVLSLGPSIAGFTRLPVLIPRSLGGGDSVVVMAI
jgi:hypothetical protein